MNKRVGKVFSFLTSIMISFMLFLIPAIPVLGILTDTGSSSSVKSETNAVASGNEAILVGIEIGEALRLYAVEFFFDQGVIEVREIQQISEEKTFLENYNYSGASSLLREISINLPNKLEKYVILDKNWSKKFLKFLGGAIVTFKNSYYNDNNKTQDNIAFENLEDAFSRFGGEAVVESIAFLAIGKDENEFYENLCFLFENADTNISYPDFVKHKEKFKLLRR